MKTFQIITDSSCDLPQELADKLDLQVLPLHFTIGGQTYANYLDGREIGFHDFFERIRQGEEASTSAVNPESFREAMEKTLQQGLDILFIGVAWSGTLRLPRRARAAGGQDDRAGARLLRGDQAASLPLVHGGRSDVLKARRQNFCNDGGFGYGHADQARHAHG